jgi:hypothetical protein
MNSTCLESTRLSGARLHLAHGCTEMWHRGYIADLVPSSRVVRSTEAARPHPAQVEPLTPYVFTRLLHRTEPDSTVLWAETGPLVRRQSLGARRQHPGQALRAQDRPAAAAVDPR